MTADIFARGPGGPESIYFSRFVIVGPITLDHMQSWIKSLTEIWNKSPNTIEISQQQFLESVMSMEEWQTLNCQIVFRDDPYICMSWQAEIKLEDLPEPDLIIERA